MAFWICRVETTQNTSSGQTTIKENVQLPQVNDEDFLIAYDKWKAANPRLKTLLLAARLEAALDQQPA